MNEVGHAFAADALRRGVYVVRPDGSELPIPVLLSPVIVPRALLAQCSHDARLLLDGLCRVTRRLMEEPGELVARLFGDFSELETEGLKHTYRDAEELATARVDYLLDDTGRPRALEMNATIPAMQGYSDAVAEAWLRTVHGLGDADVDRILAATGRNTDELLSSLRAHYVAAGGRASTLDIVIVARDGDAQRGELDHYVRRWTALGQRVEVVTPADIRLGTDGAEVRGRRPDLFYRHIFARRLDPRSDFARMLLAPRQHRIFNPIASHLEVKGTLALLSEAAANPDARNGLGRVLDENIIAAVQRTVPWTRVLGHGPSTTPAGRTVAELAAWVRDNGPALVLKRSWDYGGKSVFLGAELDDSATQSRLRALSGLEEAVTWQQLVDHAVAAPEAWVVQELVEARPQRHLRVEADGVRAYDLYLDLSAYTNLGNAPAPTGGVVRASASRIVNILGGGGLAPLFTAEALGPALLSRSEP